MTIVAISQPRYLPAGAYLHRFEAADVFVYLDTVQYTPRDWENRNRIKGASGVQWLSVPVIHQSRTQPIREVRIDNEQRWAAKHREALIKNYRSAPFFDAYFEFFDRAFSADWAFLIDLNDHIAAFLSGAFGFRYIVRRASEFACAGRGQDLLIGLTKAVDGSTYLSGPLGRNYIEPTCFESAGLKLLYHACEIQPYRQLFGEFVPRLSAIDILFNCGGQAGRELILAGAHLEHHSAFIVSP